MGALHKPLILLVIMANISNKLGKIPRVNGVLYKF